MTFDHILLFYQKCNLPTCDSFEQMGHKYDCNLFETVLGISNWYRQRISTSYSVQIQNSGTRCTNFFAWEEGRM